MNELIPGLDGPVPQGVLPDDPCCPPDLCSITVESMACAFIGLLPSGPLWDAAKENGIQCAPTQCENNCVPDNGCTSLVNYAIYRGRMLHSVLFDALWPALREASADTAYDTMDQWLDKLGWRDCYNSTCRDPTLGELTPYEIMGECGPEYCPPTIPIELQRIYKRGVILALNRLRYGVIRSLAGINFVLKDLYSELVIDPEYNPEDPSSKKCLVLRPTADFGHIVSKEPCPRTPSTHAAAQRLVQLYLTPGHGVCVGAPDRVYPTLLAAHCIARALLPSCNTVCIKRIP